MAEAVGLTVERESGSEPSSRSRKRRVVAVIALLAVVAGGYWTFARPGGEVEPKAGEVMTVEEHLTVNLAGGRYLRIGLALQLREGVKEVDESKALDAAIELFSGKDIADVTPNEKREEFKKEYSARLIELYPDEVMDFYFTTYVTQ